MEAIGGEQPIERKHITVIADSEKAQQWLMQCREAGFLRARLEKLDHGYAVILYINRSGEKVYARRQNKYMYAMVISVNAVFATLSTIGGILWFSVCLVGILSLTLILIGIPLLMILALFGIEL